MWMLISVHIHVWKLKQAREILVTTTYYLLA